MDWRISMPGRNDSGLIGPVARTLAGQDRAKAWPGRGPALSPTFSGSLTSVGHLVDKRNLLHDMMSGSSCCSRMSATSWRWTCVR